MLNPIQNRNGNENYTEIHFSPLRLGENATPYSHGKSTEKNHPRILLVEIYTVTYTA